MADVYTSARRSEIMSRIRGSRNKSTELRLIDILKEHAVIGWRRNHKLIGKPDLVFPLGKVAVFVDGCFWHGCPEHYRLPSSNTGFWKQKITRNRDRDKEVSRALRQKGWKVLRIWEHELTRKNQRRLLTRLRRAGLLF